MRRNLRGGVQVVLGQIGEQFLDHLDPFLLFRGGEMRHAALGGMDGGSAQFLLRHFFAGHLPDDAGAGQEHIGSIADHQGEVSQGGGVYGSAGAGAEDAADLRDDAGSEDVAFEDLAIAGEGVDAFLDARAAAVVQSDDRGAVLNGQVHHLADFLGHGLAQGSTVDGEILGEDVNDASADRSAARDDTVSVEVLFLHAEIRAAMLYEHVEFLETALIQQQGEALTRRHLALPMLDVDPFLAPSERSGGAAFDEVGYFLTLYTHQMG